VTTIAVAVVVIAVVLWLKLKPSGPGVGFVSGNGRVKATEVDIATKLAGRVQNIMVDEGDFVWPDRRWRRCKWMGSMRSATQRKPNHNRPLPPLRVPKLRSPHGRATPLPRRPRG
jgi:hypothetical protein